MTEAEVEERRSAENLSHIARGGTVNLIGAVVWGISNFVLLGILTRSLGAESAGVVIFGIAIFNILATVAGLGCSSGLVRHISMYRATGQAELIYPVLVIALIPVVVVGVLLGVFTFFVPGALAALFNSDSSVESVDLVVKTMRWMSPFIPISAVYWALIQGLRGFDTMRPTVMIDKIGRGLLLPVAVGIAVAAKLSPPAIAAVWAATTAVAIVPTVFAFRRLVADSRRSPVDLWHNWRVGWSLSGAYWRFTGPRAVGQISEVSLNWADTVIVGSLLGATAAGIYGAGTRYVLPGLFVAEAIMQVAGPRVSGLLSASKRAETSDMLVTATGWQVTLLWPIYLVVFTYSPTLLKLFGGEVVAATGALRWLSVGLLIGALFGPAASVILMSGHSMLAMANTLVLIVLNVVVDIVVVRRFGITAVGAVWGLTILLSALLPALQARFLMGLSTFERPAITASIIAVVAYAPISMVCLAKMGQTWAAVAASTLVGTFLYGAALTRWGSSLRFDALRPRRVQVQEGSP